MKKNLSSKAAMTSLLFALSVGTANNLYAMDSEDLSTMETIISRTKKKSGKYFSEIPSSYFKLVEAYVLAKKNLRKNNGVVCLSDKQKYLNVYTLLSEYDDSIDELSFAESSSDEIISNDSKLRAENLISCIEYAFRDIANERSQNNSNKTLNPKNQIGDF